MDNFDIFLMFAQDIDPLYALGSKEYSRFMF